MKNTSNVFKWVFRYFFIFTIAVFIIFYLWWLRIAPFVWGNDPTSAFIGGCILLIIYGVLVNIFAHAKSGSFLKALLAVVNILVLCINALYLYIHIPSIETTLVCNGIKYYITYGAPLGDEQWTYVQMSKWKGLVYESHFWGYSPDAGANEIRCDAGRNETLFLRLYADPPSLTFIDGENPQSFYKYTSAQLGDNLYFLSEDWSIENCTDEQYWACDNSVYTLYKCKSSYTDCNPLSIIYTSGDVEFLELRADETTNEINLYEQYFGSDDETLIFTYGKNSSCYVDGCTIASK